MKIQLVVKGLSAYLPVPFDNPQTMHILIPDLSRGATRQADPGSIDVCVHQATLTLPDGGKLSLAGEHIEFSGSAGGLTMEPSFLARMSDMSKIAAGSEVLDKSYLADPPASPGPGHVDLSADLHLTNGDFFVGESTPTLEFRSAPQAASSFSGEVVSFVRIIIDVPGNEATLSTRRFTDHVVTNSVPLKGADGDIMDVILTNLCDRLVDPNLPDKDFVIYYDFSFNYKGPKPIPYPVTPPLPPSGPNPGVGPLPASVLAATAQPPSGSEGVNAEATTPGTCIAGLFGRSS